MVSIDLVQVGKHPIVIENIHAIMAAAAVKFDTSRMDQLFDLIQEVSFHLALTLSVMSSYVFHAV